MSAIQSVNMPLANASLIQSVQERDHDVGRAQNQFASSMRSELHRQGAETVTETARAEDNGVDQDGRNGGQQQSSQQRKQQSETENSGEKHGWRMGVDNDGQRHLVNLIG